MRSLLSNEERLARRRARDARQAAERRKPDAEFKAPFHVEKGKVHQRRSGVRDRAEKFISDAEMTACWHYFWGRRGIDMPATTTAGVCR